MLNMKVLHHILNKYNQVQPGKEIHTCVSKPLSTISYTKSKRQQQPCYKNMFIVVLHRTRNTVSQSIIIWLYYSISVLFSFFNIIVSVYCYIIVVLYYCMTSSLLLYQCVTVALYYCIITLLYESNTVVLHHNIQVLAYYCITV